MGQLRRRHDFEALKKARQNDDPAGNALYCVNVGTQGHPNPRHCTPAVPARFSRGLRALLLAGLRNSCKNRYDPTTNPLSIDFRCFQHNGFRVNRKLTKPVLDPANWVTAHGDYLYCFALKRVRDRADLLPIL